MAKKKSRPKYTSKGGHKAHSRWLKNLAKKENKANPTVASMMQSRAFKMGILSTKNLKPEQRRLKEKWEQEDQMAIEARRLMRNYGFTYAQAIQAIKTKQTASQMNKKRQAA